MKTLADFKRLAVIGALFKRSFPDRDDTGADIRKVSHVQSNALATFCMIRPRAHARFTER